MPTTIPTVAPFERSGLAAHAAWLVGVGGTCVAAGAGSDQPATGTGVDGAGVRPCAQAQTSTLTQLIWPWRSYSRTCSMVTGTPPIAMPPVRSS